MDRIEVVDTVVDEGRSVDPAAEYRARRDEWDEDDLFVPSYLTVKPTGTFESWNEDIGFPVFVLHTVWNRTTPQDAGYNVCHLLWALSWMRKHNTYRSMAAEWGTHKSTFCDRVNGILAHMMGILGMMDTEEHFLRRWTDGYVNMNENATFYAATCTVDGVECAIHEWQNRARQNLSYSYKAGATTVKYQVATQVHTGKIVHVHGPCLGATSDMTMLASSPIIPWMARGEKLIVDLGYVGATIRDLTIIKVATPSTPQQRVWNKSNLKNIGIHGLIFHFLAHLINMRIDRSPIRSTECKALFDATMQRPKVYNED